MSHSLEEREIVLSTGKGQKTILVVEDESLTLAKISRSLENANYQVIEATTGEQALELCCLNTFDLVVLDILLPGISGFEVCERLRGGGRKTAIIMLSNLHEISDRIRGLGLGADDYMIKPFHPDELVARVKAVLRRSKEAALQDYVLEVGGLRIEFHTQKCFKKGLDLDLTHKEFQLLAELCSNRGMALSRSMLYDHIWGEHHFGSGKTLDVYIGRLRHKVEDDPENPAFIRTVRGKGYMCG